MKIFISFLIVVSLIILTHSQSTEECGKRLGCFTFPTNCKNSECTFIYKWGSLMSNTSHQFVLAAKIEDPNLINSAWIGIGFSTDPLMGNDDVIICKNTPAEKSVQHLFNFGKFTPSLLDSRRPDLGISDPRVITNNNFIICSLTREKSIPGVENYFDLNKKFHVLAALGQVGPSGELIQHILKLPSQNPIDFTSETIAISTSDGVKVKAHASFMIISWMILATFGMAIARYYKFIFPDVRLFDLKIWFVIHRPIMIVSYILTFIGFFIILADQNWTWVDKSRPTAFAHSIFGIIVIILAFIQIFVAFFRPHQDHSTRYIFNYFHGVNGALLLLLSTVTLFLGSAIRRVNLGTRGIGLMVGWTVWMLVFVLFVEISKNKLTHRQTTLSLNNLQNSAYQNNQKEIESLIKLENIKFVLLGIHILVSIGLAIGLIYMIATEKIF
ncbi:unnamed protein product [Brachionus calyciflorus]|uniref:Ferric-chelate reductase 1 n=1 Tax=Brachionus calyciflorus TaxID=104777 RepID=A0A813W0A2_9BILA|nr:unnamed protein product [Brachionus calyciflorus]